MLNKQKVIDYIKLNLSSPINIIELSNDEIWSYLVQFTIPEFSSYWPDEHKMKFDPNDPAVATDIANEYIIQDEEGMEILDVVDLISNNSVMEGHPIVGMTSGTPEQYVQEVLMSSGMHRWGYTSYEFEFIHPNILRIAGNSTGLSVIVYERVHPYDLRTISGHMEKYFLKFALADIKIIIGNRRKKFQNYTTPHGEIPLNADEIKSEGKDEKQQVIDYLRENVPPYLVIDVG